MSRENVLVSAQWAEDNLDTAGVVFAEVDEDTSAYEGGHIPGAVRIDWKTELQDPVRRDFVDRAGFEKLLSAKGISNDDTVILYGGNNNWFAAYAYWYFKLYGHEAVKLLDGGRKKWELDGRPLSQDEVKRAETDYKAQEQDLTIRAFRDEVVAAMSDPDNPFAVIPGGLAYVPSKTALNSLTVQYARELRDEGFLVNAADPGYTATDLNNHSGFRTVREGAAASVYLATLGPDGPTGGFFTDNGTVVAW
ncbi:rhodanese-like domain-containing protein [Kibdelosporangium lantanae]|uniref:thiosulfate sulfurtransferase n=1 Tax=Kibdelosporangium lantanae TaxID=1497396 RepID=A0ABW3MEU0_9PSEU